MTLYLLDNSVLQRIDRQAAVALATEVLLGRGDLLASSDVSLLEVGYSAKNAEHHRNMMAWLAKELLHLETTPAVGDRAREIQGLLFGAGIGRSAGVVDLLHAATAIEHGAVVTHYDADFELLAGVEPRLRQQWIVPRGTID